MPNIHVAHFFLRRLRAAQWMAKMPQRERPISICYESVLLAACITLSGTAHIADSMFLVLFSTVGSPYKSVGNGAAAVEPNGSQFGNVPFVFSPVRIYFLFFFTRCVSPSSPLAAFYDTMYAVFFGLLVSVCGHGKRAKDFSRRKFIWNNFQVIKLQLNFRRWNVDGFRYAYKGQTMCVCECVCALPHHFEMSSGFVQMRRNKWFTIR